MIGTEMRIQAPFSMKTVIKRMSETTGLFKDDVIAYFFRNGGAVTAKNPSDFLKGCRVIQHFHNSETFVSREMFIFTHSGILLDLPASPDKDTKRFARLTSIVLFAKFISMEG